MTEFDEIVAIREEIAGVADIISTLNIRKRGVEQKMAEAEAEFNSLAKLNGFAKGELERKQKILRRLEEQRK